MYLHDPQQIEALSMQIIEDMLAPHTWTPSELAVVKRVIHTTGDPDYQQIMAISNGAIEAGLNTLRAGSRIVTDTRMAFAGINKNALTRLNCTLDCYINDAAVAEHAHQQGITRSMAAMELAFQARVDVLVIGNAPTALFRALELIEESHLTPKLIIGVPVGFVGASEAKAELRKLPIPSITTVGTKGGSNVAAAILNALLYMALEDKT